MSTVETVAYWRRRGADDARKGRGCLMRMTRGGVRFNVEPPDHFFEDHSDEDLTEIVRAYHDAYLTTEAP